MISGLVAGNKEVPVLTDSVISCTVKGVSKQMTISWSGYEEEQADTFVSSGTFDSSTKSQIGTLAIAATAVVADKTYTCTVSSTQHPKSAKISVPVHLRTSGKFLIDPQEIANCAIRM